MCSQTERINVTKISIPKSSIDSMQSLSRSQWHFFLSRKNNPKFYIEPQKYFCLDCSANMRNFFKKN